MATLMGRKIVIVGGSSGIGLGVAAAALERGANLVIVGRSQDKLLAAQRTLGGDGRVKTVTADMAREAEISAALAGIGSFDHIVSTAGAPPPGSPIAETDADEVRAFIDNKLVGAVLLAKHAARRLKPRGSMTFTSGINKDKPPVPGGAVVSAVAGSFRRHRLDGGEAVARTRADPRQYRLPRLGRHTDVRRTRRRGEGWLLRGYGRPTARRSGSGPGRRSARAWAT